jgi:TRAP-type uncharacterized transport system fused permease subunit
MSATSNRIEYHEARQYSLLEHALRDRHTEVVRLVTISCAVLSIALALFHLFVALFGTPETRSFRSTHLTVMLVLALLLNPLFRSSFRDAIDSGRRRLGFSIDLLLVLAGIGVQVYTMWDVNAFQMREGELTRTDIYVGTVMVLLVLEATRRAVGIPMICVTLFFVAHSLYAHHFPGFMFGPPTSYE